MSLAAIRSRDGGSDVVYSLSVVGPIVCWGLVSGLLKQLLKQCYRYHKIRKAFSKFYHRHSELIVKYNIGLKTLLQQGISEPKFYSDLVYKFKRIVGKPNFSYQFKKIVKRYIKVGYNLDVIQQSTCLVLNTITVSSYGFLFNCTTVGQDSDSMTALT